MAEARPNLRPVDYDPFGPAKLPLTEPQAEMWTADQMGAEASCSYNQCFCLTLRGPLSLDSMRSALGRVVERHDALRAVISADGTGQEILPQVGVEVPLVDLTTLSAEARDREIARLLDRETATPFRLDEGPLIRAFVVRESPDRHRLILTAHHIVCDGWSSAVLFRDLGAAYAADRMGLVPLLDPQVSYREYVLSESGPEVAAVASEDEEYWVGQYPDGEPVLDLPLDRARPALKTYRGAQLEASIDDALYRDLKKTGARAGCTLFIVLLAAWESLIHRLSGQNDFVVGIPVAGQALLPNGHLVAHCVNTLPLRARLDPKASFAGHLKRVRQALAEAQDHQRLTFGSLVRRLNLHRDPSRTPLVPMTFNIDKIGAPFDFGDLVLEGVATPKAFVNFELAVNVVDSGRGLSVECAFNTDLFEGSTIERWLRCYRTLLQAIVEGAEATSEDLEVLDAADRDLLLRVWNETAQPMPAEKRLHVLFEEQARRTPSAEALLHDTTRWSYDELNRRANGLARRLVQLGVNAEVPVGVAMERSPAMIVAMLAILKAGGAYLPLDPAYPRDRVAFMLRDSRAALVVTQRSLAAELPAEAPPTVIVDDGSWEAADEAPLVTVSPTNLAYVIYTSGSTGLPKGVAIEHRSAGTLVHWARRIFSDDELAGVLASTSICFDLSVFEIFVPLSWGGRVILAGNALELAELRARGEVSLLNTVPSAAAELVREKALPPSVRTVCLAGEPLTTSLVDELYATGHVAKVYDLYGPSEDTTYSTFALRTAGERPTIGRPIANTQAYVLDNRRRPLPIGAVGELYLAGDGLARGYLHRPELTDERFVPNPFAGGAPARMYRTGDRVRYRGDGSLEFLGRLDHQVKLRGFRIELGEVEAALARLPGVAEVAVIVREDREGDRRLVAYLAGRFEETAENRMRAALRERLPEYMVPSAFVCLAELPRTPNGKLDRKALPSPTHVTTAEAATGRRPGTPTERKVAAVWADVLDSTEPGADDDFFDIGGHSLLAARIVARLRTEFRLDLGLRHLFERPTISGLSQTIDLLGIAAAKAGAGDDTGAREEIEI